MSNTIHGAGTIAAGPYEVTVEYRLEPGGAPEVTAFAVRRPDGEPIPPEVRRDLCRQLDKIADYLDANRKIEQARRVDIAGTGTLTLTNPATGDSASAEVTGATITRPRGDVAHLGAEAQVEYADRRRRRRITPDLLREVADVYLANVDTGAPTKAVRKTFYVEPAQASRYVKAARAAGLIPPLES